jgi:hypothetical protein
MQLLVIFLPLLGTSVAGKCCPNESRTRLNDSPVDEETVSAAGAVTGMVTILGAQNWSTYDSYCFTSRASVDPRDWPRPGPDSLFLATNKGSAIAVEQQGAFNGELTPIIVIFVDKCLTSG